MDSQHSLNSLASNSLGVLKMQQHHSQPTSVRENSWPIPSSFEESNGALML
jgi:hypothetical protein